MMSEEQVERLLRTLCVDLGFCLDPETYERLCTAPPETADAFANAVFVAEGMNPEGHRLFPAVRRVVADHMADKS